MHHDVMFPGLGRKGLQLPECAGGQEIACWGPQAVPCPLCLLLLRRVADPGAVTRARWDVMATAELILTARVSQTPGATRSSCANHAVPGTARPGWEFGCSVARPVAELRLVQRCAARACTAMLALARVGGCLLRGRLCLHFLSGAAGMDSLGTLVRGTKWHHPFVGSGDRVRHVPLYEPRSQAFACAPSVVSQPHGCLSARGVPTALWRQEPPDASQLPVLSWGQFYFH